MKKPPVAVKAALVHVVDTEDLAEQFANELTYEQAVDFVRFLDTEMADSAFTAMLKKAVAELKEDA